VKDFSVSPLEGRLLVIPIHIRPGWKGLPWAKHPKIVNYGQKSFITSAPGVKSTTFFFIVAESPERLSGNKRTSLFGLFTSLSVMKKEVISI
jgi:hypothetical protein